MNEVFLTKLQQQKCTQAANYHLVKKSKISQLAKKEIFFQNIKVGSLSPSM